MAVITLLTDFGSQDEYVALMKGVILTIHPQATIVDISHHIDPQNVVQAAHMLRAAYPFFPPSSIHVSVVDPGVGTDRAVIVLKTDGHLFLAPDNGLLSLLLQNRSGVSAFRVRNDAYFRKPVSRTFHGRDIFAPVAAHLSRGVAPESCGPPIAPELLARLHGTGVRRVAVGELEGRVIWIDHFGNLVTSITAEDLRALPGHSRVDRWRFRIREHRVLSIVQTYAEVAAGSPLALIGSRGYLEIAVNQGSAQDHFKAVKGDRVRASLVAPREEPNCKILEEHDGAKKP